MVRLNIKSTKPKEIVDITDEVSAMVERNDLKDGLCHLFLVHTTAALATADLDPGTDLDMLDTFNHIVPKLDFRHAHDPGHVKDHILGTIIGASLTLVVYNGKLLLGTWQRVVFVEFDGPREREIIVSLLKENP